MLTPSRAQIALVASLETFLNPHGRRARNGCKFSSHLNCNFIALRPPRPNIRHVAQDARRTWILHSFPRSPDTLAPPLNSRYRTVCVVKNVRIRYSLRTEDSAGNFAHRSDMARSPCRRASRGVLTELVNNSLPSSRLVVATRDHQKMRSIQSLPPGQNRLYSPCDSPAPTGNRRTRIMQRQTVEENWAAARARQLLRSMVGSRSVSGWVSRTFITSDSVLGIESRRADAPSMLCRTSPSIVHSVVCAGGR